MARPKHTIHVTGDKKLIDVRYIVTCHYFEFHKDYKFSGETHDFWELVYTDKGQVVVTADKQTFTLPQGSLFFHKPNEFHAIASDGVTAPNVLIITFLCTSPAMRWFENRMLAVPKQVQKTLFSFIEECTNHYDNPFRDPHIHTLVSKQNAPVGGAQMLKIHLEQALITLLRTAPQTTAVTASFPVLELHSDHDLTNQVISYLEQNIYCFIKLTDVINHLHYSKTTLCTQFKQATGHSVMEYYTLLKISHAKKMIRENAHTISQISDMLQYADHSYFARVFKKTTGMTPGEYEKSIRPTRP